MCFAVFRGYVAQNCRRILKYFAAMDRNDAYVVLIQTPFESRCFEER
jgi:hypothetical protein